MPNADDRPPQSSEPTSKVGEECQRIVEKFRNGTLSAAQAFSQIIGAHPEDLAEEERDTALASYFRILSKHEQTRDAAAKRGRAAGGAGDPEPDGHESDKDSEPAEEDEPGAKRARTSTEEFLASAPWVVRRDLSGRKLNASLEATALTVFHATRNLSQVKASLIGPGRPPFPDSEWTNLLTGRCVDLDKVLSSLYGTLGDEKRTQLGGDLELIQKGSSSAATRKVTDAGEWHAAFEPLRNAIEYAFPHRAHEVREYGRFMGGNLIAFAKSSETQRRVIEFDKAIRTLVAQRGDLELTDFHDLEYRRIELQWLHGSGAGSGNSTAPSKPAGQSKPAKPKARSVEICRKFNRDIAHDNCHYFHACENCDDGEDEGGTWEDEAPQTLAEWTETAQLWRDIPQRELLNLESFETIAAHPELFRIVTPIKVVVFERYLEDHPNQPFVKFICRGLRDGFWPNADKPETYPTTWDNSERTIHDENHRQFLRDHRDTEIAAGRFSESFGTELLPGTYSSPIGVVPKAETGELRLVVDQTAGEYSLNSMIPRGQRGFTKLDDIRALGQALRKYRKDHPDDALVLYKSDVKDAFRLMPADPLWQILQVITIDGQRYIDRCCTIGNRWSMQIYNGFMGLVIWIATRKKGILDTFAYVDDAYGYERKGIELYYKPYDAFYPAKQTHLLQLWDELGIPHKKSKQLFGDQLTIIGFEVNANLMRVTISDDRRADLIAALEDFIAMPEGKRRRHSLREFYRIAGWVNWVLNVFPLLRPGLCELYAKMAGKTHIHAQVQLNQTLVHEIKWLLKHLRSADGVRMLDSVEWGPEQADVTVYTDASGSGLAFYSPAHATGFQSPLTTRPHEDGSSDIFFFEALAVCSALKWASTLTARPRRLAVFTDNDNTVAMNNTLKCKRAYNSILLCTSDVRIESGIDFHVYHIAGKDNIIADALSRWMNDKAREHVPDLQILPFIPPQAALGAVTE